jgi:putative redox protein
MIKTARVNWIRDFKLEGITDNNQVVEMDTGQNATAASPAQLLLQSLAGCTMMDCVPIIAKSRKKLLKFWIDIEAEEAEEHPKVFTKIHMTYHFIGTDLEPALIERAIKLSEEKYCRVHAMLCASVTLTSSYKLNEIG